MAKAVVAAVAKKAVVGAIVAGVGIVGVVASSSQPASPLKGVVISVSGGQPTAVSAVYVPPVIAKPPVVVPVKGASATGQVTSVAGGQATVAKPVQIVGASAVAAPPPPPPPVQAAGGCGSGTATYIPPSQAAMQQAQAQAGVLAQQAALGQAAAANWAPGNYIGGGAVAVSGGGSTVAQACSGLSASVSNVYTPPAPAPQPAANPCDSNSGGSNQAGYTLVASATQPTKYYAGPAAGSGLGGVTSVSGGEPTVAVPYSSTTAANTCPAPSVDVPVSRPPEYSAQAGMSM